MYIFSYDAVERTNGMNKVSTDLYFTGGMPVSGGGSGVTLTPCDENFEILEKSKPVKFQIRGFGDRRADDPSWGIHRVSGSMGGCMYTCVYGSGRYCCSPQQDYGQPPG